MPVIVDNNQNEGKWYEGARILITLGGSFTMVLVDILNVMSANVPNYESVIL